MFCTYVIEKEYYLSHSPKFLQPTKPSAWLKSEWVSYPLFYNTQRYMLSSCSDGAGGDVIGIVGSKTLTSNRGGLVWFGLDGSWFFNEKREWEFLVGVGSYINTYVMLVEALQVSIRIRICGVPFAVAHSKVQQTSKRRETIRDRSLHGMDLYLYGWIGWFVFFPTLIVLVYYTNYSLLRINEWYYNCV